MMIGGDEAREDENERGSRSPCTCSLEGSRCDDDLGARGRIDSEDRNGIVDVVEVGGRAPAGHHLNRARGKAPAGHHRVYERSSSRDPCKYGENVEATIPRAHTRESASHRCEATQFQALAYIVGGICAVISNHLALYICIDVRASLDISMYACIHMRSSCACSSHPPSMPFSSPRRIPGP